MDLGKSIEEDLVERTVNQQSTTRDQDSIKVLLKTNQTLYYNILKAWGQKGACQIINIARMHIILLITLSKISINHRLTKQEIMHKECILRIHIAIITTIIHMIKVITLMDNNFNNSRICHCNKTCHNKE